MILNYALMFACGALTKFTDNLIDEPFKSKYPWLQFATGIIYGALAGYLATSSTEFATLIIAITIGVLFAGKIDAIAHQIAIGIIFGFFAFFGLPEINFIAMAAFIGLGFLDEAMNDFMDKAKKEGKNIPKTIKKIVSARLSLEIGTLVFGFLTGNFVYFIAIFAFDSAYNIVDKIMPKFMKKFDPEYGPQLVLDLYKANPKKLTDKKFIKSFLEKFPKEIGMKAISKPQVIEYRPNKKEESGISALILIAESHITIHTYPLKQLAKIDIMSCKKFDHKKTVNLLKKAFEAQEVESHSLYRGKHYPIDIKKAMHIAEQERTKL